MLIFWRLVLAHFIADFTLQTNKIAQWKRVSRWGMMVHVLCHPLMYLLFCRHYLTLPWIHLHGLWLNGWTCVMLIVLLHWVEDEARVYCIRRGTPDSTAFLLWDQAVHLCVLLALAPLLNGTHGEPVILTAICAVLLAHFTSVLIFFVENDLYGTSTVLANHKYMFMVERLAMAALFILSIPWGIIGVIVWAAIIAIYWKKPGRRTLAHNLITFAAVTVAGFSLRQIFLR